MSSDRMRKSVSTALSQCTCILFLIGKAESFSFTTTSSVLRTTTTAHFAQNNHGKRGISRMNQLINRRSIVLLQNEEDGEQQRLSDNDSPTRSRRGLLKVAASTALSMSSLFLPSPSAQSNALATVTSSPNPAINVPKYTSDVSWPLGKVAFSLLPLAGTSSRRATVKEEIVPNTMWTFDQIQGVVNVNVPVRMTVVKLSPAAGGGLFVHNPLAPTSQLMSMMRELEAMHGPVRHIVLGTVALEHKSTFGPFAQAYSDASVWIQPGNNFFAARDSGLACISTLICHAIS